eukprot:Hpha_TRINITY_DN16903_c2_g5::TRINITY_DN16903_c2_g5_i1::g.53499::m.53499
MEEGDKVGMQTAQDDAPGSEDATGQEGGMQTGTTCPETLHLHLIPDSDMDTPWGRFKVVDQIGVGTFSRIWKARFRCGEEERDVALKVYRATTSRGLVGRDYEARFLKKIQERFGLTPHVLEYLGYFYIPGTPAPHVVVVAELLGGSLLEAMHQKRWGDDVLEWRKQAGVVLRAMLLALAKLERLNLAHCDVKPENLLSGTAEGEGGEKREVWKLSDFNHCRDCDSIIPAPALNAPWQVGTAWYNAPELLTGYSAAMAPCVDVWGLACTVAEVACGGSPLFAAGNAAAARGEHGAAAYGVLRQILGLTRQRVPGDVVSRSSCRAYFQQRMPDGMRRPSLGEFRKATDASSRCHTPPPNGFETPSACASPNRYTPLCDSFGTAPLGYSCPPPPSVMSGSICSSTDATPLLRSPPGLRALPAPSPDRNVLSPRHLGGYGGGGWGAMGSPVAPAIAICSEVLAPPEVVAQHTGVAEKDLTEPLRRKEFEFLFGSEVVSDFEGELFGDLIHSMMRVDPAERLSSTQALRHPYFNAEKQGWCGKGAVLAHFRHTNRVRHDTLRTRYDLARAALAAAKQVPPPMPTKLFSSRQTTAPLGSPSTRETCWQPPQHHAPPQYNSTLTPPLSPAHDPDMEGSGRRRRVDPVVESALPAAAKLRTTREAEELDMAMESSPPSCSPLASHPPPAEALSRHTQPPPAQCQRRPPPAPPPPRRHGPPPPPPGPAPARCKHAGGSAPPPYTLAAPTLAVQICSAASSPAFRSGHVVVFPGGSPCRLSLSTPGLTPESTPCRLSPPGSPSASGVSPVLRKLPVPDSAGRQFRPVCMNMCTTGPAERPAPLAAWREPGSAGRGSPAAGRDSGGTG